MYVKPKQGLTTLSGICLAERCGVMGHAMLGAVRKEKCGANVNVLLPLEG